MPQMLKGEGGVAATGYQEDTGYQEEGPRA